MAFIGTLRSKMGTWVVVFVFVAIAAFILGDIFSGQSNIMNWGRNTVGEIAGTEISYETYQNVVREREANWYLNTGREPGERDMPGIRQQAWDLLIARNAIEPQYAKLGIEVTDDEEWDMLQGKNVDAGIRQAFTDPQTGQFNAAKVVEYMQQIKTMPATSEPRIRWEIFQRDLRPGRQRIKYENLLIKSSYITKAEAEREYHLQTDVAEVKYVYVPFYAVSDSAVKVTDADLEAYYNKNKEKYKTEEVRSMKYVSVEVVPSATDSAAVTEDLARAVKEFETAEADSVYASNNTDGTAPYTKYNLGSLPAFIQKEQLEQGNVIGPFLDGQTYKVVKVSRIAKDTVYSARAKHILIKWDDASDAGKAAAKEKARDILKDIKGGADFGQKAREFGSDGTAQRGGDLGWFSTGQMVKPFQDAVFAATKTGVLNDVVETDFGYHIIDVTNTKTNDAYVLATVEREIVASDATMNEAFRKAENFASEVNGLEDFDKKAQAAGLTVLEAKNITAGERRISTLGEARTIVQWLFRDASVGTISQVFEVEGQNVVAIMTSEISKGYKPLSVVKEEIRPAVTNEVKGREIIQKLEAQKGTLDEVAAAFGRDAGVYSSSDLKLSSNSMPTVGFDPIAVGTAFSLEPGKRSKPIAGENGVVLIELQNKTVAPAAQDYGVYKTQLEQGSQNRSSYSIAEAIKDKSEISDKRYKFF
ncbi:SurA N-terminal domain-containing protein [Fulvivirgaceae bacterium PWU5]|uniref:Periplasmic chaperone PpiD n=1 Tax=Dawidia cretensis TaxID=2782350 RepID=A0AAP2GPE1_9BACT|nr:peptidylprolyl isomerase [Dawidia cretensis]MBT1708149.1 SurA N-terminal domain-containing protein [Dawidia cretensis]